jgi:hypothetical protein
MNVLASLDFAFFGASVAVHSFGMVHSLDFLDDFEPLTSSEDASSLYQKAKWRLQ